MATVYKIRDDINGAGNWTYKKHWQKCALIDGDGVLYKLVLDNVLSGEDRHYYMRLYQFDDDGGSWSEIEEFATLLSDYSKPQTASMVWDANRERLCVVFTTWLAADILQKVIYKEFVIDEAAFDASKTAVLITTSRLYYPNLAMDGSFNPHVIYHDGSYYLIQYRAMNGRWSAAVPVCSVGTGDGSANIVLGNDGMFWVQLGTGTVGGQYSNFYRWLPLTSWATGTVTGISYMLIPVMQRGEGNKFYMAGKQVVTGDLVFNYYDAFSGAGTMETVVDAEDWDANAGFGFYFRWHQLEQNYSAYIFYSDGAGNMKYAFRSVAGCWASSDCETGLTDIYHINCFKDNEGPPELNALLAVCFYEDADAGSPFDAKSWHLGVLLEPDFGQGGYWERGKLRGGESMGFQPDYGVFEEVSLPESGMIGVSWGAGSQGIVQEALTGEVLPAVLWSDGMRIYQFDRNYEADGDNVRAGWKRIDDDRNDYDQWKHWEKFIVFFLGEGCRVWIGNDKGTGRIYELSQADSGIWQKVDLGGNSFSYGVEWLGEGNFEFYGFRARVYRD